MLPHRLAIHGYRRAVVALLCCAWLLTLPAPPTARAQQIDLPRGPWVPSWEVLYGGFRNLDDLAVTGPDEAWAVDRNAFVSGRETRDQTSFVRWQDGLWRSVQVVNDVGMSELEIVENVGFAVGDGGAIFRLIAGRWSRYPSPTGENLTSLHLVRRSEGWASGDRGTILRWDGGLWLPTALPIRYQTLDVPVVAGDGQGGAYALVVNGDLLRFVDGTWQLVEGAPRILRANAIRFSDAGRGLFLGSGAWELADGSWEQVGSEDVSYRDVVWIGESAFVLVEDLVYRYQGRDWRVAPLPTGPRYAAIAADIDGILAIGTRGSISRLGLEQDRGDYLWPLADGLEAVDAISRNFAWAGGTSITHAMVGSVDGGWTAGPAAGYGTRVIDLDLASRDQGWAVGSQPVTDPELPPDAKVWRWDGQTWQDWEVEKSWRLYEVEVLSEQEAWLSGSNVVARWDGEDWQQVVSAPFTERFSALSMRSGGDNPEGWFGAEGEIYHMQGDIWTPQSIGEGFWVPRLVSTSEDEGWAIARHLEEQEPDRLLRFDGTRWEPVELPIPEGIGLIDVDASMPGQAWVLVDANGLLHWTGSQWEYHVLSPLGESIEPLRVRVVQMDPQRPDVSIWLAGRRPAIARYEVVEPRQSIFIPLLGQSWRP